MSITRLLTIGTPLAGLLALQTQAADWPAWRGADRSGVSPETGLLKEWPKDGPKQVWKINGMGIGYSSPAVVGNRINVVGSKGDDEMAFALNSADGKQLWATKIGPVAKGPPPYYPGPRATPSIDGDRIYVLGSDGDLVCLD